MKISLIIPVCNEEKNIKVLLDELDEKLRHLDVEVCLVDDASTDGTFETAKKLCRPYVKLIRFRQRCGQTQALAAGMDFSKGDYVATLDGDLQSDPADVLKIIEVSQSRRWDFVVGRRINRQDSKLGKQIPSRLFNGTMRFLMKVNLRDINCPVRFFKRTLFNDIERTGHWHRFLPALALLQGIPVREIEINHRRRIYGKSKYGFERIFPMCSDLLLFALSRKIDFPFRLRVAVASGLLFLAGITLSGHLLLAVTSGAALVYLFCLTLFSCRKGARSLYSVRETFNLESKTVAK